MATLNNNNYNADSITVLEGLEAVRMNPGMYIGSSGTRGLHHLAYEIIDNSIDEVLAGFANKVIVSINEDGSMSIIDNGRGIPVDINSKTGLPAIRLVFEVLHAGGKFGQGNYKVSGGLHGVGASVVNAFSEWMDIRVHKNGSEYKLTYRERVVDKNLKKIGRTERTGTSVTFKPDNTIFQDLEFKYQTIRTRLQELAFLNKGLEICLIDKKTCKEESFKYDGGLSQYVEFINNERSPIHNDVIYLSGEQDGVQIDFAMQYIDEYIENYHTFVNNISTIDGGTHLQGFKVGLTKAINDFCRREGVLKEKDTNYSGEDISEGITGVLSIKLPYRPEFEGQTKAKLGNPEVRGLVQAFTYNKLQEYFALNKATTMKIVNKVILTAKMRNASKKLKEAIKKSSSIIDFLDKLTDATSKNRKDCEIYIVEGDSAGGSAKQARNKSTQAILSLRGKSINVEKHTMEKVLENKEIRALDAALGVGVADECDVEKCRYSKIIILTDSDVDGEHIKNLLLTYFYRFKKPLLEAGMIYIGMPPLYKVVTNKSSYYIFNDKELDKFKSKLGKRETIKSLQRYKGLGEMNAEQLKGTTMNPETRNIKIVNIEDDTMADRLVSTFMGSKSEPRCKFLEDNLIM